MLRYTFAYPPSTNNLFANGTRGRYRTKAYQLWAEQAGYQIIEQGRHKLRGPVSLSIALVKPDRRKRDLSNAIKAVEDLLVSMAVIEDDSLVQRLSVQWAADGAPCTVIINRAEAEMAA